MNESERQIDEVLESIEDAAAERETAELHRQEMESSSELTPVDFVALSGLESSERKRLAKVRDRHPLMGADDFKRLGRTLKYLDDCQRVRGDRYRVTVVENARLVGRRRKLKDSKHASVVFLETVPKS